MQIAILVFERITALDAVGPYEVLSRLPDADVRFVAPEIGPKRTDEGSLVLLAEDRLDDVPAPDIVVVPGGVGEVDMRADEDVQDWLRSVHQTTRYTTSVCTGALVLEAAGLLRGKRATTHWLARDALARFGALPSDERMVVDGKIVTAAGVSSGIDMALWLVGDIAGTEQAHAIQLMIEYDPQPPFDAGAPAKCSPALVERLRASSRFS
ncbi:MAG: DJ-1/PfpI family protein [Actinobacteria bacterium]|nr:MAG: DJ-1/PfpI family protein [Actinomycetota bacterium]